MFLWTGVLDRPAYIRRATFVVALLVVTILLLPQFVKAFHALCSTRACGEAALVFLWPCLFGVMLTMILSVCMRRARDAGLHPSLGVFPPLILFGDQLYLKFVGLLPAQWSTMPLSFQPFFSLFGLTLMALLAVPARGALRHIGGSIADAAMLVLATWIAIGAVEHGSMLILPLLFLDVPPRANEAMMTPSQYAYPAMPLFLVLAAYRLWWAPPPQSAPPAGPNRWRPLSAAIIGLTLALVSALWTLLPHDRLDIMVIPAILGLALVPIILPTFLMYALFAAALFRVRARPDAIGIAALVATLIPFGLWTWSLASVLQARAQERAEVASIPRVAMPTAFGGIVIEGDDNGLVHCTLETILSADRDVGDVLTHFQGARKYERFTLATLHGGEEVNSAPSEHILIRLPQRPDFLKSRHAIADPESPPVEVYAVDSSGSRLVAATYTVRHLSPALPPLLMVTGWYPDFERASDAACRSVEAFLQRELLNKLQREHT